MFTADEPGRMPPGVSEWLATSGVLQTAMPHPSFRPMGHMIYVSFGQPWPFRMAFGRFGSQKLRDQYGPIWTNGFLETQTSHGLNVRSELDIFQRQVDEVSMPSVKTSVFGRSTGFPWFWVIWKLWKVWKSGKVNVDGVTPWQTAISLFQKDILVFAKHLGSDTALFPCGHVPTVSRW